MKENQHTQMISTGGDPRSLPEFVALREEIDKASRPSQPEVSWKLVESLALTIFKNNGVDLHTATYYTFARTRLQGLAGFCEGVELLAALIGKAWQEFWPQSVEARTEMLDWFNSRTGNILRQQLTFSPADLPLLYRAERALQIICDKLQQVELKRIPRVENLLFFVQNTRQRHETPPNKIEHAPVARTLVYSPDVLSEEGPSPFLAQENIPGPEHTTTKVTACTSGSVAKFSDHNRALFGFTVGVALMILLGGALWWTIVRPLQEQLNGLRNIPLVDATLWQSAPDIKSYPQKVEHLLSASPLAALEAGKQTILVATSRWPEREAQQNTTARWNDTLKLRAENSPSMRGYLQAQRELREFSDLIVTQEKNKAGLTLSYLKTVAYKAESSLNEAVPLEAMLTQLQNDYKAGKNNPVLEKQFEERLNGLLSRYFLTKALNEPEKSPRQ